MKTAVIVLFAVLATAFAYPVQPEEIYIAEEQEPQTRVVREAKPEPIVLGGIGGIGGFGVIGGHGGFGGFGGFRKFGGFGGYGGGYGYPHYGGYGGYPYGGYGGGFSAARAGAFSSPWGSGAYAKAGGFGFGR